MPTLDIGYWYSNCQGIPIWNSKSIKQILIRNSLWQVVSFFLSSVDIGDSKNIVKKHLTNETKTLYNKSASKGKGSQSLKPTKIV